MGYANLRACVEDLAQHNELIYIEEPVDPYLEMACIQRLAFENKAPALLFTHPKKCRFAMLANLFGTKERVNFIFRDTLEQVRRIFAIAANPQKAWRAPLSALSLIPNLLRLKPKYVRTIPVAANTCKLADLPHLTSWPGDGGAFITLPLVYSESPDDFRKSNLGMYRIQISGNEYEEDEAGLHYQLQRGIGIHHAQALQMGKRLYVNVCVGGPPALTIAAIMPLPEGISELLFAGILGGRRVELGRTALLPLLAQCDFALQGYIMESAKPEGPFGDHLGYYSLKHNFPVLKVVSVHHRNDAIWPFTSVGRPPQEDTVFGDFIHECTGPLVGKVFPGIKEIHAVDAAGVHPLLLALASERYVPWAVEKKPVELLTLAMHLLGCTQTALAKYLLITDAQDTPGLSCRDVQGFLAHILERTDFERDLHFITRCSCDTLDYSGYALNEGSRLIWAAYGEKRRSLGRELHDFPDIGPSFSNPRIVMPGVIALTGIPNTLGRTESDSAVEGLADSLGRWVQAPDFPLAVIADDSLFCAASLRNFLWITFTRTDPGRDIYGAFPTTKARHWGCHPPLLMDARLKPYHAPPLEDDPAVLAKIKRMAKRGGPLFGIIEPC